MTFSPFFAFHTHATGRPAAEIAGRAARRALPNDARPALGLATIEPQNEPAIRLQRDWQTHVDAGRIGVRVAPEADANELRFASLEAILGTARRGSVW